MATTPPQDRKLSESQLERVPSGLSEDYIRQRDSYEHLRKNAGWTGYLKSIFLAKSPSIEAPLEYGGNRVAEEPPKGGIVGVLLKCARMFGPGMIIAIAYVDPDNFQSALQDGESFQYKILDMVLISVLMACYLQVSCTIKMHVQL
jgi:hypothetical protein